MAQTRNRTAVKETLIRSDAGVCVLASCRTSRSPSCPAISTGPLPNFPPPSLASLTLSSQIAQLQRCEPITEGEVKQLCLKAREILIEEGNVQVVDSPVTVRYSTAAIVGRDRPRVRYAVTSMGNFGICFNSSTSAANAQRPTICSWVRSTRPPLRH
jgi:hypothetical protein